MREVKVEDLPNEVGKWMLIFRRQSGLEPAKLLSVDVIDKGGPWSFSICEADFELQDGTSKKMRFTALETTYVFDTQEEAIQHMEKREARMRQIEHELESDFTGRPQARAELENEWLELKGGG